MATRRRSSSRSSHNHAHVDHSDTFLIVAGVFLLLSGLSFIAVGGYSLFAAEVLGSVASSCGSGGMNCGNFTSVIGAGSILFTVVAVVMLIFGVLFIVSAIGTFMRKHLWWLVGIVLSLVGIALSIVGIFLFGVFFMVFGIVEAIWPVLTLVFLWLGRDAVDK